jgi:hypothetical protein
MGRSLLRRLDETMSCVGVKPPHLEKECDIYWHWMERPFPRGINEFGLHRVVQVRDEAQGSQGKKANFHPNWQLRRGSVNLGIGGSNLTRHRRPGRHAITLKRHLDNAGRPGER